MEPRITSSFSLPAGEPVLPCESGAFIKISREPPDFQRNQEVLLSGPASGFPLPAGALPYSGLPLCFRYSPGVQPFSFRNVLAK